MDEIKYWIETEGTGHWFFIAFPIVLCCAFIWFKGRRVRFLIPSLLISIIIVNPLFYKYWDKLGLYAYWRILWIVPVIPILASVIPSWVEKVEKSWTKTIVVGVGVGLFVIGGTFLYNGAGGSFVEAANVVKLPDNVVRIANRLLELDDHPRIIAEPSVSTYIRQYTGEIETLFGRDIQGGYMTTASALAQKTYTIINDPANGDLTLLSQTMLDNEYEYIVLNDSIWNERLISCGFDCIDRIGEYGIYKATGFPSVIKRRNALGQVVMITEVDETGSFRPNEKGYTNTEYAYDRNGYLSMEYHTDIDGNGVADENGIAGYEREYDDEGHVILERTLGEDRKPIVAYKDYAEVRREYQGNCLVKEEYYDEKGKPKLQQAGYAAIEQVFDAKGDIVLRRYLNCDWNPVNRTDGYSEVRWIVEENGIKRIVLFDVEGNVIEKGHINLFLNRKANLNGWSEWITPRTGAVNYYISIGTIVLPKKTIGDKYACQIEIEFKNVSTVEGESFLFQTQGAVDNGWKIGSFWYPNVARFYEPPEDGIYSFSAAVELNESKANASEFEIGFRCDRWATGSFRVRNIKIEKGDTPSEWSPGI